MLSYKKDIAAKGRAVSGAVVLVALAVLAAAALQGCGAFNALQARGGSDEGLLNGAQDVVGLHMREDLLLDNYSWLGESQELSQGKVRIPIDRAMDLLTQRGLPLAPSAEQAPLMTGDAKPTIDVPLTSGFAPTGYEQAQARKGERAEHK
jgi:hypothetical protein